jgi:hypothetical protein
MFAFWRGPAARGRDPNFCFLLSAFPPWSVFPFQRLCVSLCPFRLPSSVFRLLSSAFPLRAFPPSLLNPTAGAIALKLVCPTSPGENTIVRGSAPLSQGREVCSDFRILGTCPAAVLGSTDITSL